MTAAEQSQLSFPLQPREPFGLQYFVTHTGVTGAVASLEHAVEAVIETPNLFQCVFLYGPSGSGKSHLLRGYADKAIAAGVSEQRIVLVDVSENEKQASDDEWARGFIAEYERIKRGGGLFFIEARLAPVLLTENPHVQSRLLAGGVELLNYPREEELKPLLQSLLERHNLRLSGRSLEYLLKRLPLRPLSFDNIFAKISELSLSQGKPAREGVVRAAVSLVRNS